MKHLFIGCTASVFILCGFSSCGKMPTLPDGGIDTCSKENLQSKPWLCPDRGSLGFAQEFGSGTFIGQKPIETISIRNNSVVNLTVDAVDKTGDGAFTMTFAYDALDGGTASDLPATIRGNKNLYIQVVFTPTAAKAYSGSITVTSNASNFPSQTFALSGCGVPADGGTSPCYHDGGQP
jgi:hypothetical protein